MQRAFTFKVTVEGGIVQDITCHGFPPVPINVQVKDFDNEAEEKCMTTIYAFKPKGWRP